MNSRQAATHFSGSECCTYPVALGMATRRQLGIRPAMPTARSGVLVSLSDATRARARGIDLRQNRGQVLVGQVGQGLHHHLG